jgi:hypothetical protein
VRNFAVTVGMLQDPGSSQDAKRIKNQMADLRYKILYNGGRFRSVKYDKILLRVWV